MVKLFEVTATGASEQVWVGDAKRVGLLFRRADHSAGSSAFTVKGGFGEAGDNPTMSTLNLLIDNVTNTNAQQLTRVNGKTLAANGDAILWLDPNVFVTHLEVSVAETTDGTHSAWLIVQD